MTVTETTTNKKSISFPKSELESSSMKKKKHTTCSCGPCQSGSGGCLCVEDLRTEGCFHAEHVGAGVGPTNNIPAETLFARNRGGKPFATAVSRTHNVTGCGGSLLPMDTVPGQAATLFRQYDARPWTSTRKATDLFSLPPYISLPPAPRVPMPVEPPFRTSKSVDAIAGHFQHVPDEYRKRVTAERPAFRLKAGHVPFRLDPRLRFEPGAEGDDDSKKKKKRPIPRSTFNSTNSSLLGTFSPYTSYVPLPYEEPKLTSERRPIFTWYSQSKRSMPIAVPWSTGLKTAEMPRPSTTTA